jgi:hypothetical protein
MPEAVEHGSFPIYLNADNCEHVEPPELGDDYGGAGCAWDAYHADHPNSRDIGEPVCILTEIGSYCPACTDEGDLPTGEYVECRLAAKASTNA